MANVESKSPDKEYLSKYVEGFKDALAEAGKELGRNEHKDFTVQDYGKSFEDRSNAVTIRQDDNKGHDEGYKDGLATVGQDLHDYEFPDYSVEDYGKLYQNVVRQIGDCLNCPEIGSEKGCEVGKTIWCPRILEILKE